MHFLIYTSAADHLMSDQELAELLEQSRFLNVRDQITGMLLYKGGSFMQVIEGEKETILKTFARIEADQRHKDIFLLRERQAEARSFADWSMGFRSVAASDLKALPGYAGLSGDLFTSNAFAGNPHIALKLLKSFHQNIR